MTLIAQIERKNYLATPAEVETLASERATASHGTATADSAYFRILLAATQNEIAGNLTLRPKRGAAPVLAPEDTAAHLKVFEALNKTYYAAVLKGSEHALPDSAGEGTDGRNAKALARNRRTNYARTAASAIRGYIRNGHDIRRLAVPQATKAALRSATPDRAAAPEVTLERASARLFAKIEELGAKDESVARAILQRLMQRGAPLLSKLGVRSTTKPETAIAEMRPLKTPSGSFFPTTMH
jgi:hypothetical protein